MAFFEMSYYSDALKREVIVNVILPEKRRNEEGVGAPENAEYKTLYLFHGLSGNRQDWIHKTSIIRYALKYNIAVVMPEVGRSWYTNTAYGEDNFTFVAKELPEVCRGYFKGLSSKREDNFVAGQSMGGYGAVKVALCCPEVFGGCAELSGSLDVTRKNRPTILLEWKGIFGFDIESPLELEKSEHDLFELARKNKANGVPFPKFYMWCGTEDSLLAINRSFHNLLDELGVEHLYEESEGDHSWKWWDLHIQDALKYLFG